MTFPDLIPNEIRTWRGPINRLMEPGDPAPLLEVDTITDGGKTFTRAVRVEQFTLAPDPANGGESRVFVKFVHHEFESRSYAPEDEVTAHRLIVNIA